MNGRKIATQQIPTGIGTLVWTAWWVDDRGRALPGAQTVRLGLTRTEAVRALTENSTPVS